MSYTKEQLNGMLSIKDKEFKRLEAKLALRDTEIKELKSETNELNDKLDQCYYEKEIERERFTQLKLAFKKSDIKNKKLMDINTQKAKVDIVLEMLNGFEELGKALNYTEELGKSLNYDEVVVNGIKSAHDKFKNSFESVGVEEISAVGKFDPYIHEPIEIENCEDFDDNTIIEEIRKGYTLNGDIIRKSEVKICKKE